MASPAAHAAPPASSAPAVTPSPLPMIPPDRARHFANEWVSAWNAHDLERILSHYTDDFSMTSPFIGGPLGGEPSGTLRGKDKVRAYWAKALERMPTLHFELLDVTSSVHTICIYYKSVRGLRAVEWLRLNAEGKVVEAAGHYSDAP